MRSLVIGGTSALGLALVERLRREHADVLCIVRGDADQNSVAQLAEWGADLKVGDATDPMLLPEALAHRGGREWVVVCAGGLCLSEGPQGAAARNFPSPLFKELAPLLSARLPERMVVAVPAATLAQGDTVARNDLFKFTESHKRGLAFLQEEPLKSRVQVVGLPPIVPTLGPLRQDDAATDTLRQLSALPAETPLLLLDARDAADRIFFALQADAVDEAVSLGGLRLNVNALKAALGHGFWARAKSRFLPASKGAGALARHACSIESGRAEALWGMEHRDLDEGLSTFSALIGK
jgi:nucleoside-diphosphate-sugar epimerase